MNKLRNSKERLNKLRFLKDVLICSLGAYGGPEAHLGVFMDQMVTKRKYLTEEELVELVALCSILPGPTSTQAIVAMALKRGGSILAILAMLVWAAPVLIIMTALSFLGIFFHAAEISSDFLKFIGPMAVGFITLAAWKISRKVITDKITLILMIFGAAATYLVRSPLIFPFVLITGGVISIIISRETSIWTRTKISPPWRYLYLFIFFASGSAFLSIYTDIKIIKIFESFFRYGYLVFGGGQVVVPLMHTELVEINQYMTNTEFLTGYGLVQGLPGPMFSFAAYAGGIASSNLGVFQQLMGAMAGGIAIFLPGLLLIYFIYPVWENIKKIKAIKISLKGINAVAGGMITSAAIILMQQSGINYENIAVTIFTIIILYTKKVPAPFLVITAIALGFII